MPSAIPSTNSATKPQPSRDELRAYAMNLYLTSDEAKLIDARSAAKRTRRSSTTLQVVAVGQTIIATALMFMPQLAGPNPPAHAAGERLAVAALFWVLVVWSHAAPLVPAIIGLIVYVGLWAVRGVGVAAPDSSAPLVFLVGTAVRILMAMLLLRAVIAGLQHRKATAGLSHDGV